MKHFLFKTGDRVRLIINVNLMANIGAEAIVRHASKNSVNIEWIRNELSLNQNNGGYDSCRFELISNPECQYCKAPTEREDKYIVCTECYRVQE